jgi:hypothetical protein
MSDSLGKVLVEFVDQQRIVMATSVSVEPLSEDDWEILVICTRDLN